MYIPKEFVEHDATLIQQFLNQHRFGTIVTNGKGAFPELSHIPFSVHEEGEKVVFAFHLAVENELVSALRRSKNATLIVQGAHGYISSAVYTHVNVPTYNYQSVQVSGSVTELTGETVKNHLSELVRFFEKDRTNQWSMSDFPSDLLEEYLKGIVAFRLEMNRVEASFKLSQNRNETDFNHILDDLTSATKPNIPLVQAMKQSKCPNS